MTLSIGLSSGALYPRIATEDVPAIAAAWGARDLELMLQTHGEYDPAFIATVAANARAAGCRVHSLHTHSFHPVLNDYRRRIDEGRALFQQAVDAAHRLGADAIVWHGATRKEAEAPGAWDAFLETASIFAQMCHEEGVTLAVENVSWCVLSSVRDVSAFAARIPELGPPGSVGFAFDPFQAAEAGANHFMMLAAMTGRIVDLHLSDYRDGFRHLVPGRGDLPWSALFRAIVHAGYDGPMAIEATLKSKTEFQETVAFLTPLLAAALEPGEPSAPPPGVQDGIELFNAGKYYEAHEVIEHEWHAELGPIRRLYQGLLQIGVGFHHARAGNHRGAVLLLTDGIDKTAAFAPARLGLDLARLLAETQPILDAIIAAGPDALASVDLSCLPQIDSCPTPKPFRTEQP